MANPGYPMQPMQQPQMQGQMPQHGAPPQPVRRGTSKIVPIVVSAGLAVGTFCGLLFGVGTGEPADASPSTGNTVKAPDPSETAPVTPTKPATTGSTTPATKPATTSTAPAAGTTAAAGSAAPAAGTTAAAGSAAPAAGTTTTAAAGSGSTAPAAGTGAGSAKPAAGAAEPAVKKPKLTVEVTPEAVAATAKITIDGKAIEGNAVEIDLGKDAKKEVKIVVKASGYKTVEQKVDVDSDVAVKIELIKRPATPTTGPRPTGPTPTGPKKKPPGGLIDI